jgi:hypothetical protein
MARAATLRFKQSPRPCNATTGSTQHQPTDKAGTATETSQGRHQTPPAAQSLHCLTLRQPQSRTASLIGKTNRNPNLHKKILDQKGLTTATEPR